MMFGAIACPQIFQGKESSVADAALVRTAYVSDAQGVPVYSSNSLIEGDVVYYAQFAEAMYTSSPRGGTSNNTSGRYFYAVTTRTGQSGFTAVKNNTNNTQYAWHHGEPSGKIRVTVRTAVVKPTPSSTQYMAVLGEGTERDYYVRNTDSNGVEWFLIKQDHLYGNVYSYGWIRGSQVVMI